MTSNHCGHHALLLLQTTSVQNRVCLSVCCRDCISLFASLCLTRAVFDHRSWCVECRLHHSWRIVLLFSILSGHNCASWEWTDNPETLGESFPFLVKSRTLLFLRIDTADDDLFAFLRFLNGKGLICRAASRDFTTMRAGNTIFIQIECSGLGKLECHHSANWLSNIGYQNWGWCVLTVETSLFLRVICCDWGDIIRADQFQLRWMEENGTWLNQQIEFLRVIAHMRWGFRAWGNTLNPKTRSLDPEPHLGWELWAWGSTLNSKTRTLNPKP